MRITFVNVGYGDAILMESDTGYTALLDGGGNLPQEFEGDPYRVRCAEYLRTRQIHHIDALLISHIHEDHVCGLLPVLKDVNPQMTQAASRFAESMRLQIPSADSGILRALP